VSNFERLKMNIVRWLSACVVAAGVVAVLVIALANRSPEGRAWLSTLLPTQASPAPPSAQRAEQALAEGDAGGALQLVRQALASGTTDAATDYGLGNVAQRAGDDSTAVLAYARGEATDPQYVWNFIALGQASARLGRLAPAETQLRRAVQLAPTMQFLHYDLAMVELSEKRPADALQDLDAELRISPGFPPAVQSRRHAAAGLARLRRHVVARASPSPTTGLRPSPSPQAIASPTIAPSAAAVLAHLPATTPRAALDPLPSNVHTHNNAFARTSKVARTVADAIRATRAPTDNPRAQTPEPAPAPTPTPEPTPPPTPTPLPPSVAADARDYLLAVSRDLAFTHALPEWEPGLSTPVLAQRLASALATRTWSIDALLRLGTSALVSGRLALAERAFDAASGRGRSDWRGPYLQALTARAAGDDAGALELLREAKSRAERPETYTSLAIIELERGDTTAARASAERAVSLEPAYGPGRFTAGMLALIQSDTAAAARNLEFATNLSGMPGRSGYFLGLVSER
jgi:tetratricopeptide (TPR) repeat protein